MQWVFAFHERITEKEDFRQLVLVCMHAFAPGSNIYGSSVQYLCACSQSNVFTCVQYLCACSVHVVSPMCSTVQCLCDPLTAHLSTDGHVKLYRHTVLTIISQGKGQVPHAIKESAFANFELKTKSCRACEAAAMTRYNATYAAELELNKAFDSFVTNYQLSYQGQNSAKVQVGSKYNGDYSDFLDKDLSQPGDEYLPLGKSFQEHVACFLK